MECRASRKTIESQQVAPLPRFDILTYSQLKSKFRLFDRIPIIRPTAGQKTDHHSQCVEHKGCQYIYSSAIPFVFQIQSNESHLIINKSSIQTAISNLCSLQRLDIKPKINSKNNVLAVNENCSGSILGTATVQITFKDPLTAVTISRIHIDAHLNKTDLGHVYSTVQLASSSPVVLPSPCAVITLRVLLPSSVSSSVSTYTYLIENNIDRSTNSSSGAYYCLAKLGTKAQVALHFSAGSQDENAREESPLIKVGHEGNLCLVMDRIEFSCLDCPLEPSHLLISTFHSSLGIFRGNETKENYIFRLSLPNKFCRQDINKSASQIEGKKLSGLSRSLELNLDAPVTSLISELNRICTDKPKCRKLHHTLGTLKPHELQQVGTILFVAVMKGLTQLVESPHGNFLLQTLLPTFSADLRRTFITTAVSNLYPLRMSSRGPFYLQSLVESLVLSSEQTLFFNQFVQTDLILKAKHPQANFIIKKITMHFPLSFSIKLISLLGRDFFSLATHKVGICTIKYLIARFQHHLHHFTQLVTLFQQHTAQGKNNSYFNFGIQHLLEIVAQNNWKVPQLDALLLCFLTSSPSLRTSSKAVTHTLELISAHPDARVRSALSPHLQPYLPL